MGPGIGDPNGPEVGLWDMVVFVVLTLLTGSSLQSTCYNSKWSPRRNSHFEQENRVTSASTSMTFDCVLRSFGVSRLRLAKGLEPGWKDSLRCGRTLQSPDEVERTRSR
jgi:hypothetical protein